MAFEQGDIYKVELNPTKGHEQQGWRPVLIVSNNDFNSLTDMVKVIPITNQLKEFPMHLDLPDGLETTGQALVEQERSIDLNYRKHRFVEHCPQEFLGSVLEMISETY
ncbi:type II toxin-antitoxin system PemK/MazF family toxin [Levilactobacillus brevis]|uniref:type II toxin-antitoxin system PemK/MazF family toxin n=1 Tax=Levilactobacillus brevis TaxID=1580 RepID=UPI0035A335EF